MDYLLTVDGVGKKYSRDLKASLRSGTRSLIRSYIGGEPASTRLDSQEFWAVRDVSFRLRRGEILGILGQNGAGKSTLLKCISGKLKLDAGSVVIGGQIGHLLEMSAGFEPTLTGRENVHLRGRLMNMTGKTLDTYVGDVAEFAELDEFFDSPVQFYSSGMRARLGFAASSVMRPDVLIIDEVLAVGDLSFRLKCYERINDMARNAAVLFVSHSLGQVARMCNRGLYMEKGRVLYDGEIQNAIALYQEKLGDNNDKARRHVLNPELVRMTLLVAGEKTEPGCRIAYGESIDLELDVSKIPRNAQLRIMLKDASSGLLMDWSSVRSELHWPASPAMLRAELGRAELNPGAYALSILVSSEDGREHLCISDALTFRVTGELYYASAVQKQANWIFID
jgi:lipopolysaccharide transport system ATP-binding protein